MTRSAREKTRARPRSTLRAAAGAALALALAPSLAAAELNCERSVEVNSAACVDTVIPSVKQGDANAVCAEFRRRLAARCKPTWDQVQSCEEFSRRFADLLVSTCLAKGVSERACTDWGNSFAIAPLARCERKRTSY